MLLFFCKLWNFSINANQADDLFTQANCPSFGVTREHNLFLIQQSAKAGTAYVGRNASLCATLSCKYLSPDYSNSTHNFVVAQKTAQKFVPKRGLKNTPWDCAYQSRTWRMGMFVTHGGKLPFVPVRISTKTAFTLFPFDMIRQCDKKSCGELSMELPIFFFASRLFLFLQLVNQPPTLWNTMEVACRLVLTFSRFFLYVFAQLPPASSSGNKREA